MLQKICNKNKMNGKATIYLIGNDRLDMKITGNLIVIDLNIK